MAHPKQRTGDGPPPSEADDWRSLYEIEDRVADLVRAEEPSDGDGGLGLHLAALDGSRNRVADLMGDERSLAGERGVRRAQPRVQGLLDRRLAVTRAVSRLPPASADVVLPVLDRYAELVRSMA